MVSKMGGDTKAFSFKKINTSVVSWSAIARKIEWQSSGQSSPPTFQWLLWLI
jgi:hypothetical protein